MMRRWQVLTQDKQDTLLLLCASALTLAPHAPHIPIWAGSASALLLLWRALLTLSGQRLPPPLLLLPLSGLLMLGIFLHFKTLLGREAGLSMLVVLFSCKLLEMHARRDLFVVIFLGLFLLLCQFFHGQSPAMAMFALFSASLLLTALHGAYCGRPRPTLLARWRTVLGMFGLAAPLCLLAFILFPRLPGPLWNLPSDAHSGRSGLSNTLRPGSIGELVLSEDLAFRVHFSGPVPQPFQLYWRGPVLETFDGQEWTRASGTAPADAPQPVFLGAPTVQEIDLEAHQEHWLLALDLPAQPDIEARQELQLSAAQELLHRQAVRQRLHYRSASYLEYRFNGRLSDAEWARLTALPGTENPRSRDLGRLLAQREPDPQRRVQAMLQRFRQEAYSYTLTPAVHTLHAVDAFLFGSREGFCEHFASSFVFVMRASGLPARVVTGYQGGERNPYDGDIEIRQSDAHAWAEVWLDARGWVRIDPTAAVAPERIRQSAAYAVRRLGTGTAWDQAVQHSGWLADLRLRIHALEHSWDRLVVQYNTRSQEQLLELLGWEHPSPGTLTSLFLLGAALLLLWPGYRLLRTRRACAPLDRLYSDFQKLMQLRYDLACPAHEGPLTYAARLHAALPETVRDQAVAFVRSYCALRYAPPHAAAPLVLRDLKRQYRRLLAHSFSVNIRF